jgi:arsenite-transporting ATPase
LETVVFDTAPTGHTLRFLSFPAVLQKGLSKLSSMGGKFGGMLQQVSGLMGMGMNSDELFGKLEAMNQVIEEVNTQFQNAVL